MITLRYFVTLIETAWCHKTPTSARRGQTTITWFSILTVPLFFLFCHRKTALVMSPAEEALLRNAVLALTELDLSSDYFRLIAKFLFA